MIDATPSAIDLDRLCNALATIALDWWQRQVHKEAADGLQSSTAGVETGPDKNRSNEAA